MKGPLSAGWASPNCECVVWRDGDRRCELWRSPTGGFLRVYDGTHVVHQEPTVPGRVAVQAGTLRSKSFPKPSAGVAHAGPREGRHHAPATPETHVPTPEGNRPADWAVRADDLWIVTDAMAYVLDMSGAAERLLGITRRRMIGRQLLTFLDGDRAEWRRSLMTLSMSSPLTRTARVRPKERRPVMVAIEVSRLGDSVADAVRWVIKEPE